MASEAAAAATPDITYHVRRMSHKQLMAAAAAYNLSTIGTQDPIADTLRGIEDVADLRPGTQPALAFSLGTVPADSPYFKAWKGVRRGLKPAAAGAAGAAAPLAFKVQQLARVQVLQRLIACLLSCWLLFTCCFYQHAHLGHWSSRTVVGSS
jgi:hypothetical protein